MGTNVRSETESAFSATDVSNSITPAANSLLLVFVSATAPVTGITDTLAMEPDINGDDWVALNDNKSHNLQVTQTAYGNDNLNVQCWMGRCSGSPGTGTVTPSMDSASTLIRTQVVEIDAADFAFDDPIVQWKETGTGSGTSHTDNLTYAVDSANQLVACMAGRVVTGPSSITEDTGWTELSDVVTSDQTSNIQNLTSPSSTQFGASYGDDQADGIAGFCVEVRAPVENGVAKPTLLQGWQQSTFVSSQLCPESGSVTVTADAYLYLLIAHSRVTGGPRTISTVTDTFDTQRDWELVRRATATGSDNTVAEIWRAQAAASGDLTGAITITPSGACDLIGAALLEIDDSNIDWASGSDGVATSASLGAGIELNGTYDVTPADNSRLIGIGISEPNSTAVQVLVRQGWTWIGPPVEEGGNATTVLIEKIGDGEKTFGSVFCDSAQTSGAALVAIEVAATAAAAGETVPPRSLSQRSVRRPGRRRMAEAS